MYRVLSNLVPFKSGGRQRSLPDIKKARSPGNEDGVLYTLSDKIEVSFSAYFTPRKKCYIVSILYLLRLYYASDGLYQDRHRLDLVVSG